MVVIRLPIARLSAACPASGGVQARGVLGLVSWNCWVFSSELKEFDGRSGPPSPTPDSRAPMSAAAGRRSFAMPPARVSRR